MKRERVKVDLYVCLIWPCYGIWNNKNQENKTRFANTTHDTLFDEMIWIIE